MKTIDLYTAPEPELIAVIPPGAELPAAHAHQAWTALAALRAGRSPYPKLHARTSHA